MWEDPKSQSDCDNTSIGFIITVGLFGPFTYPWTALCLVYYVLLPCLCACSSPSASVPPHLSSWIHPSRLLRNGARPRMRYSPWVQNGRRCQKTQESREITFLCNRFQKLKWMQKIDEQNISILYSSSHLPHPNPTMLDPVFSYNHLIFGSLCILVH